MKLRIDLTQGNINKNVFFIGDFHWFHKNILKYDSRPFNNMQEMHDTIEERWNEVVGPEDIVIYVGDLSFARREEKTSVEQMLNRLNGKIHYIMGNHDDYDEIKKLGRFETVYDYLDLTITYIEDSKRKDTLFCCFHYPIYSWNKIYHGSICIHGHCHGNLHHGEDASFYTNRRVIDVGCMLHNYKPISYIEVIDNLKDVIVPKLTRNT